MGRQQTIDENSVLDQAEALVRESGVGALTLANVAKRAAISKGGLQYRFETKRELVRAMLTRAFDRLDAAVEAEVKTLGRGNGHEIEGYVHGMLSENGSYQRPDAALFAAAFSEPDLLAEFAPRYSEMLKRVKARCDAKTDAALVLLATDGLWLLEVIGLKPLSGSERDHMIARLLEIAQASAQR
ncbi:TetR/AcrR family transcriptional regulator [Gymnodinialimonas sp. 2305UL16-5]|uniref:TetR/AcrR family transcriptional regulator n=1 Tax=Gymnodinialimonas mytili TaxID=3126503 RepID=UPI00309ECD43